ncbi:unnamed protein product [Linum trigynum]|uniref:Uncharacterized protein n=1 Tax=Linum trigynum TaxID=586398 RepID=A0AAV2FBJ6_9ROSI
MAGGIDFSGGCALARWLTVVMDWRPLFPGDHVGSAAGGVTVAGDRTVGVRSHPDRGCYHQVLMELCCEGSHQSMSPDVSKPDLVVSIAIRFSSGYSTSSRVTQSVIVADMKPYFD